MRFYSTITEELPAVSQAKTKAAFVLFRQLMVCEDRKEKYIQTQIRHNPSQTSLMSFKKHEVRHFTIETRHCFFFSSYFAPYFVSSLCSVV